MSEEAIIKKVVQEVMARLDKEMGEKESINMSSLNNKDKVIYCNYSNRHCHISREHLDELFGPGYQLTKMKDLIQPGEFASKEVITIAGPKGNTLPVRILGPVRKNTQVEISRTDSFALKIKNVPVRGSGKIENTPGAVLIGPKGAAILKKGVIVAQRHIHFTPQDAEYFGVKDKEMLKVRVDSPDRSLVFDQVLARVKSSYALEMHIDVDEANAAGVGQMTPVTIVKE